LNISNPAVGGSLFKREYAQYLSLFFLSFFISLNLIHIMAEQPKDANIQPPTDTVEKKTTDEKSKDKKEQEEELVKSKRVPGHVVAYTRFMFFVANLV
jgi:hypothetical protein